MRQKILNYGSYWVMAALFVGVLVSCQHEPFSTNTGTPGGTPPNNGTGPAGTVCFESDILPIFNSSCAKSGCHDATTRADGYVLDSYNNIIKKGIVAGNATKSKIYEVLFKSGFDRMPQPPNPALTAAQSALIAQWINEGAKNTTNCNSAVCDTANVTYQKSVWPIVQISCLGCHSNSLANGGYNFSNYAGLKSAVDKGRLLGSINYQPGFSGMPQGFNLNACQLATIKKWVHAGALNN
jgi:hypothetical protein